jgi:hypothetical protein
MVLVLKLRPFFPMPKTNCRIPRNLVSLDPRILLELPNNILLILVGGKFPLGGEEMH